MRRVILTGFMGSGKTSVGRLLAGMLGCPFTDLDDEIIRHVGMPIVEIFDLHGEEYFREIESKLLPECLAGSGVLALGGGALLDPDSRDLVLDSGDLVYLRASAATLADRLQEQQAGRPVLVGEVPLERRIRQVLEEREKVYEKANLIIDTDGLTPGRIAKEILGRIREKGR